MKLYLKRCFILTFLLFAINFSFAQKTTYTGGILTFENSEKNIKKNIGKNVTLTYDSFFNTYTVLYTDQNDMRQKMVFTSDGSQYDQYIYSGIVFWAGLADMSLRFAKDGDGSITFSDTRQTLSGGTHISYKIDHLKLNK